MAVLTTSKIGLLDIIRSIGTPQIKVIKLLDFLIGGVIAWALPAALPAEIDPREIKRLLIIRPGGIGDAVFLIPFLRNIKNCRPDINVVWCCRIPQALR